jgi:hypothetical protein
MLKLPKKMKAKTYGQLERTITLMGNLITPSKKIDCLIAEYEMLQNNISRRDLTNLTLNSILIPSTLVILAVSIQFRDSLDSLLPFVRSSGFLPLFSGLLLFTACIFSYRAKKITGICYRRMNDVETLLEIQGNKFIYAAIRETWYYKAWSYMWSLLFILGITSYLIVGVLLFMGF